MLLATGTSGDRRLAPPDPTRTAEFEPAIKLRDRKTPHPGSTRRYAGPTQPCPAAPHALHGLSAAPGAPRMNAPSKHVVRLSSRRPSQTPVRVPVLCRFSDRIKT